MRRLAAKVSGANRYFLATSTGITLAMLGLVVLGFIWNEEAFGAGWKQAFYQGLLTSVCFFGLVGVAAAVQQVHAARGDILRKRVEYLFATRHSVSPPLVDYVESLVKRNAIYSSDTLNDVEILEYDATLRAYRVTMRKTFSLHNVFGDLTQEATFPLNFAPDLITNETEPLAELTVLKIGTDDRASNQIVSPHVITADGLRHDVKISLRPTEFTRVEHEHWTWASNIGNSGFSLRRFSERTRVVLRNRSRVTARVYYPEDPGNVIEIKPGNEVVLRDRFNVPESVRLDWSWLPPVEHPQPREDRRLEGIHPILSWNPLDPT